MTFIQPKKGSNILNRIIILLVAGMVFGAFWMIILYNNFVNLNHGISDSRIEIQQIRTQNAELKGKIFSLLDSAKSNNSLAKQLVQDKNPAYLEVNSKWSYASHY